RACCASSRPRACSCAASCVRPRARSRGQGSANGASPTCCGGCGGGGPRAPRGGAGPPRGGRAAAPRPGGAGRAAPPARGGGRGHAPAGAGIERLREILVPLQGLALPVELWERAVLPRRTGAYSTSWLDQLCAAGEVVWVGAGSIARRSGRVALYFRDDAAA